MPRSALIPLHLLSGSRLNPFKPNIFYFEHPHPTDLEFVGRPTLQALSGDTLGGAGGCWATKKTTPHTLSAPPKKSVQCSDLCKDGSVGSLRPGLE